VTEGSNGETLLKIFDNYESVSGRIVSSNWTAPNRFNAVSKSGKGNVVAFTLARDCIDREVRLNALAIPRIN